MVLPELIARIRALFEQVRDLPPMTAAQMREQRISFVYGNLAMHNPAITREMVERAVDKDIATAGADQ